MLTLTPGMAGFLVLSHTALTKMMMTIIWRGPGSAAAKMPGGDNWMAVKAKLEKIPRYQVRERCRHLSHCPLLPR